jgi:cellulose synthase/poly-beta-1,6-N-acetylglucosamine synthase-like glycosyltransferase
MIWVFAIPLLVVGFAFAGYPLCVAVAARLVGRPLRKGKTGLKASVCISARNEAGRLPGKLANLLDLAPEEGVVQILLALDGCTDGSEAAVVEFLAGRPEGDRRRVEVYPFAEGRGKAAALDFLAERATGDVLVMMDARQRVAPGAVASLLSCFADERVGVASGELVFERGEGAAAASSAGYWGYEKTIRRAESAFGRVPGATGALYAIRRELFRPIPENTLLDDVLIPMRAVMAGARCVFDPEALVTDRPTESFAAEEVRKRRTLAGNWQLLAIEPGLLLPWRNPAWACYVCHKVLRLPTPFLLGVSLAGLALGAVRGETWALVLAGPAALLVAASAAAHALAGRRKSRVLGLLGAFFGMNRTLVLAAVDAARGRFEPRWQSAERA